jgi:hypothetical protein
MVAVRVARPFVQEALTGQAPSLPADIAKASINRIVPWVLDAEGLSSMDPHNFEQRMFRRALPVLHLALALDQGLDLVERQTGRPPTLESVLINEDLTAAILLQAEELAEVVLRIRRFRVDPETQIRLLFGTGSSAPPTG